MNYFLTDHLGSVRVIVDGNGVIQERNDYYPFGARHARPDYPKVDNRLKYNGKEEQVTGDLGWLDYGARMYDSEVGRWFGVDQLAEKYYSTSIYCFCGSNPIIWIDHNGMNYDWFVNADGSMYYDPFMQKGDESKLGDTWSWLGKNGMFGVPDREILSRNAGFVSGWGITTKDVFNSNTGNMYKISLQTAYFDKNKARDFMDGMGYKYEMTQYVENSRSYIMYADKGRGKMADFIYGNQDILVERATYIPKDKSVLSYQGLKNLEEPVSQWNVMILYKSSIIRYSNPILISSSWNTFWNLVQFGSKFGSEFDYRNKIIRYKNIPSK